MTLLEQKQEETISRKHIKFPLKGLTLSGIIKFWKFGVMFYLIKAH